MNASATPEWRDQIFEVLQDHDVKQVYHVPDAGHGRLIEACVPVGTIDATRLANAITEAADAAHVRAFEESQFGQASADAIDLYVHRLRKKLEASSTTIVTLRGVGFLLRTRQD